MTIKLVDDFSTDDSKEVAEKLDWQVYKNHKKGLYNARQYAFSLTEADYCASFEHDVYLSKKWFPRIPKAVMESGYDVAQGIRVRDAKGFKESDIYDNRHRTITSEDNTFYAMIPPENKDVLTGRISRTKFPLKYLVDKEVCSLHIRGNAMSSLRHSYSITLATCNKLSAHAKCLAYSPLLSLKVANETRGYSVIFFYPMERLMIFSGALASKILGVKI